jgi:hypothetical protein
MCCFVLYIAGHTEIYIYYKSLGCLKRNIPGECRDERGQLRRKNNISGAHGTAQDWPSTYPLATQFSSISLQGVPEVDDDDDGAGATCVNKGVDEDQARKRRH